MPKEVKEVKLTKLEREIDAALELYIHRLVVSGVTTYETAFKSLDERQCIGMKTSFHAIKQK
jgi:hypothetical protein